METKKLGFLIIGISIVLGSIMLNFMNSLGAQSSKLQCNPTQECQQINSVLGISHVAVGFTAFVFALGFYLLFFNKSEKEIMEKYGIGNNNNANPKDYNSITNLKDNEPNNSNNGKAFENNLNNEKFSMLLRPLDDNERKILLAIKGQEGITQSTLRFRTDLSKAKISQVLNDFERKGLVERKAKGRTYAVFLA